MTKRILALPIGHMRETYTPRLSCVDRRNLLSNREIDRRIAELVKREKEKAR